MVRTPNAKLKVKIQGENKVRTIAYSGDETDPEKIKAHILRVTAISARTKKNPKPVVTAEGDVLMANPDGKPFTPEVVKGIKDQKVG